MVVLTASKYVTRWIGPPLMRLGLDLKGALTRMTTKVKSPSSSPSPSSSSALVDWICLLPYSQRLLSIRLYDDLKVLEDSTRDDSDNDSGTTDHDQTTRRLRDQRIELFEKTFRPVFLPTETWGDVRASTSSSSSSSFYRGWGDDVRLVAWLRREILQVYYSIELRQALISYPTLRQSPQLVRRRSSPLLSSLFGLLSSSSFGGGSNNNNDIHHDNRSLPSSQTVIKAFGLVRHGGSRDQRPNVQVQQKDTQAVRRTMIHTAEKLGGTVLSQPFSQATTSDNTTTTGGEDEVDSFYLNHVEIPDEDASTKQIPFADIVNLVSGGHTSVNPETLGPLNLLCEEANVYQWWTQEYVTHLGDYLWARACSSSSSSSSSSSKSTSSSNNNDNNNHRKKKTLIIDIGAGDGLLIKHLTEYIQHKIGLKEAAAATTTAPQTSAPSSVSLKRKKMTSHKKTSTHQQQQQRRGLDRDVRERLSKVSDDDHGGSTAVAYEPNDGENDDEYGRSSSDYADIPFVELVATDDMSWGISTADKAHVEKLTVQQTIEKYVVPSKTISKTSEFEDGNVDGIQVIVLCSWMPMGVDWTGMFRNANVDEYILIGECDDGSCGHNWYTWGNVDFYDSNDNEGSSPPVLSSSVLVPPYQKDGYERWDMDDALTPFQFSRFDCSVSKSGKTVSFRRRK